MTGSDIVAALVGVAAAIGAMAVIWKVARFIFRIDRALPTLLHIAQQFDDPQAPTIKEVLEAVSTNQTVKLAEFERYLHTNIHDIRNNTAATTMTQQATDKRVESIEKRLDSMIPYIIRHRESDDRT